MTVVTGVTAGSSAVAVAPAGVATGKPPSFSVQVAFVADPYGALTWTDLSERVEQFQCKRGRNYETAHNEAGTFTATLLNTDGAFDPSNSASPYYPYVLPYRPVRVTCSYNAVSYPLWQGYVERWPQSWSAQLYGRVTLIAVDAFKTSLGYSPGDPWDVKVRKDYGDYTGQPGASLAATTWNLTPLSVDATWENTSAAGSLYLRGTVAQGTLTSPVGSSTDFKTGVLFDDTGGKLPGSGAAGEVWVNPRSLPAAGTAQLIVTGKKSYVGGEQVCGQPANLFISAAGNTSSSGDGVLGFITQYPNLMPTDNSASFETDVTEWTAGTGVTISRDTTTFLYGSASMKVAVSGTTGTVTMTGSVPVTGNTRYQVACAATNGVSSVSVTFYDSTGAVVNTVTPTPNQLPAVNGWGAYWGYNMLSGGLAVTARVTLTFGFSGTFNVDGVSFTRDFPEPLNFELPSTGSRQWLVNSLVNPGALLPASLLGLNSWHHIAWDQSLMVIDGQSQPTTAALQTASGYTCVGGATDGNNYSSMLDGHIAGLYQAVRNTTNLNNVTVTLAQQHYSYGVNASGNPQPRSFPSQLTSDRVAAVLTGIGFPAALQVIETGQTTMSASGNVATSTGKTLLQQAADTELGNVFVDGQGRVVFQARAHRNSPTLKATYGDGPGETHYLQDLTIDYDDTFIYNDVSITQSGSSPTFTAEATDKNSSQSYGPRSYQLTAYMASQTDATNMASTYLARYKDPRERLSRISFELRSAPDSIPAVLGREIGDYVTVIRRSQGAPTLTLSLFVDGIDVTVNPAQISVKLSTTPKYPDTTY